jgi:hypothetical protein
MRAIPAIVHETAMPATAPVDNPVDFSEVAGAFVIDPFEAVVAGAVLVVDAAEVLGGAEVVVPDNMVVDEATLEERAELLDDVVAVAGWLELEIVFVGANVEIVAPEEPRVTRSVLRETWNRLIPELQHPAI